MTAHLNLQAAIVSALSAAPALASVRANSVRPLPANQAQGIVVRLLNSRSNGQSVLGGRFDWITTLQVELLARASTANADPVAAVDALLDAAWQRLSGINPISLGAIDIRLQPSIDWQVDDADVPIAAAVISVQIVHRTQPTTLTAQT